MKSSASRSSLKATLRRLAGSMLVLVLVVTGCNLPSKSVESAQPENPTSAAPLPSPTPSEPPPSVTMTGALSSGVENGSWTVEEGLIKGLRFLTGEISSEEAFGDVELISTEGTGLIMESQRYLKQGPDEQTKAEIQRYLDMLMPSPEVLDKYSRPAPQTNAVAHLASNVHPQDRTTCQNLWANSWATPTPITCLLIVERNAAGTMVRLYYPEYWGEDDPRLDSMDVIMDAASRSVEQYNGYGPDPLTTVYMVITDLAAYSSTRGRFEPDVYAAAQDATRPTTCHIGIFPYGLEGSPESLQQTIAHEMFHCYQYTNLRPQTITLPNAINDWWVEGTAEFFGATVYPTNNDEFIFNDDFRNNAPDQLLFQMSYENYLFFQYLARQGGFDLEGVIDILRAMPTSGGIAEQQDALAAVGGIDEAFHNFTRAYIDRRLIDWSGTSLGLNPYVDDLRHYGEGDHPEIFTPDSFKLGLYLVTYEDQMKFANTTEEDGIGKYAIRPREFVGAWQPVPPRINTNCDPTEYLLAVTSTLSSSADPYEVTVNANGEGQETEECECLYGSWELDNDSDYFYMYTLVGKTYEALPSYGLDTSGAYAYLKSLSGQMRINFTEDGEASGTQADYSWTIEFVGKEDTGSITSTFNGGGSADYTIQETPEVGKWIYFTDGEFDISTDIILNDRPLTTLRTGDSNTSIFLSAPARYVCSEDTLLYTTLPDIGTLIFHRVPPDSTP